METSLQRLRIAISLAVATGLLALVGCTSMQMGGMRAVGGEPTT